MLFSHSAWDGQCNAINSGRVCEKCIGSERMSEQDVKIIFFGGGAEGVEDGHRQTQLLLSRLGGARDRGLHWDCKNMCSDTQRCNRDSHGTAMLAL